MIISYTIYKKSALATTLSVLGSISLAGGIAALFAKEFVAAIIIILLGIGLIIAAGKVNDIVVKRKLKKSLEDPRLIDYITKSSLAAYSLYKNNSLPFIMTYIYNYNPYAVSMINSYLNKQITERELVDILTQYDTNNGSINIWNDKKTVLYHNSMLKLVQVAVSDSAESEQLEKKIKRNQTKKVLIGVGIFIAVFCIFPIVLILTDKNDNTDYATITEVEITECEHKFEEEIISENGYGYSGSKKVTCAECGHWEYENIPALPSLFNVHVTNKDVYVEDVYEDGESFQKKYIIFYISIENTSDKDIEKIEGTLNVECNGYTLRLESVFDDIVIQANEMVDLGFYNCEYDSRFISLNLTEEEVFNTEYENLTFSFEPTNVVVAE